MSPQSLKTVERAIDVLNLIKMHNGSASLSAISQELGLAKSSVHHILVALGNKSLVRKEEDTDMYALGYGVLELALAGFQGHDVIHIALPLLRELRDCTGETAALGLKAGLRYTYLAQIISHHEYRVTTVLGRHYPMHWAATGKAILAAMDESEQDRCINLASALRSTPRTITDPDELRQQLAEIRKVGYAVSFGERLEGSAAVAVVIKSRSGSPLGGVAIIVPESRLRQMDLNEVAGKVTNIARKMEMILTINAIEIMPVEVSADEEST